MPLGPMPAQPTILPSKSILGGRELVRCVLCDIRVLLVRDERLHLCSECKYVYLLAELWIRASNLQGIAS